MTDKEACEDREPYGEPPAPSEPDSRQGETRTDGPIYGRPPGISVEDIQRTAEWERDKEPE